VRYCTTVLNSIPIKLVVEANSHAEARKKIISWILSNFSEPLQNDGSWSDIPSISNGGLRPMSNKIQGVSFGKY